MTNVQDDLKTALDDATNGLGKYSGSPTKPQILKVLKDTTGIYAVQRSISATRRALLIHPALYENEELSDYHENRVWTMKITIMSFDRTDLQNIYTDTKKVINKYNQSPWALNGTTYTDAHIDQGEDNTEGQYMLDALIQLVQLFQDVVVTLA